MGKTEKNTGDLEGDLGDKTANGIEFTGRRRKGVGTPGIYAVVSDKIKVIGIWTSRSVHVRLRRFRSDYKRGDKVGIIDQMGIRYGGEPEFRLLEECPEELWKVRLKYWAKDAKSKGYTIWNSWEGMTGEKGEKTEWGPCGRLREIAGRHKMSEGEVLELLDQIESVVLGAAPGPAGRD